MTVIEDIVIVGAGLAGAKTAEALRELGHRGRITVVGAERHLPYERPPLSKDYLAGKAPFADAFVHPKDWYEQSDITLRLASRVLALDVDAREVRLDDGTVLPYDRLVLATGSAARRPPITGAQAEGVHYLRTVEDSDAIRAAFGEGRRLAIIGAGWIGLEVAAAARAAGTSVTVVEAAELPLLRVLGSELAQVFADLHREHGVDLRLSARIAEIATRDGRASGIGLEDGTVIEADAVVIGVGVAPEIELAQQAGLKIDNGVRVDASLRTSNPDIFAVGDIANHDHPILGRRIRVEHWATALNQPRAAAAALLGGADVYTELPYFYTDQYDLGMEYIGNAVDGTFERIVIRGDLEKREFIAFWLTAENTIVAAMNVNVWDVVDQVKPLIAGRVTVDPVRLADPAIDLADL